MLHSFPRPGTRLHAQTRVMIGRIDAQRFEQGEVPLHVVTGGIPVHPFVIEKPSRALTKPDAIRNPGQEEEQTAGERFVRRDGHGEATAPKFFSLSAKTHPFFPRLSLFIRNDLVDIRIVLQQTLRLRGAKNG